MRFVSIGLAALLLVAPLTQAADNPDVTGLSQRLQALDAQIQAEEAARLREQADADAAARADAEGALDSVASGQAAKLRAARQRAAELARQEAELMGEAPPKPADSGTDKP